MSQEVARMVLGAIGVFTAFTALMWVTTGILDGFEFSNRVLKRYLSAFAWITFTVFLAWTVISAFGVFF